MKKFDFSIIMAIYNVEEYLEEAIESVINQTIGFDKIELILINDGSPDNCADICRRYRKKYPNNIVFIDKKNEGVSTARNKGLDIAKGKYINFLDSDDKLDLNTCEEVLKFYNKYLEEVDIVAIPLRFFEAAEGDHILNYKFKRTRLIDLEEEIDAIQLSSSSSFIKSEAIGNLRFNRNLKYGEDMELINKIMLNKMKLGVVAECVYWYRRRNNEESAIQSSRFSKDYYLSYIKHAQRELMEYSLKCKGRYVEFLQYLFLYDIKWRISISELPNDIMTEEEKEEFDAEVLNILQHIDINIILSHQCLSWINKNYFLNMKYHTQIAEKYEFVYDNSSNDILAVFDGAIVECLSTQKIWLQNIHIENNGIVLEGTLGKSFLLKDAELYVKVKREAGGEIKNEKYSIVPIEGWIKDVKQWGKDISKPLYFQTDNIPLSSHISIEFELCMGEVKRQLKVRCGSALRYMKSYDYSYKIVQNYVIDLDGDSIRIQIYNSRNIIAMEKALLNEFKLKGEKNFEEIKRIRASYFRWKNSKKNNKIWIFTDRIDAADDNAEHLFRYCQKHKKEFPNIDMYFVIEKSSPHFDRMKQFGEVIDYYSEECKKIYLKADMIISSQANFTTFSPFGKQSRCFMGLLHAKRIFLQHGITKDDMSNWLHRWNKNLDMFVTASPYEYNSIINGKYDYTDKVVKLTGFPRFDNLMDEKEKLIIFMPTWDAKLEMKDKEGRQKYNKNFKNSDLYREIDRLLKSQRLYDIMKKYGYKLLFKPHLNLMIQLPDFTLNSLTILADDWSYQEIYKKGALLITDYSSAQFDFAYMGKPVLYLQERKNHLEKGYYSYEEMGFGEVAQSLDALLNYVEGYLKEGCEMKEKYHQRLSQFYAYCDKNNCKRVMDIIKEM